MNAKTTRSRAADRRGAASFEVLVRRQHDVITRQQALASGLPADVIARRVGPGRRWQRMLPGVYLTVTGTPTQDQRDTAALLYAGPGSALTAGAALRRLNLRAPRTDTIDVLVPQHRQRRSAGFVVMHRTWRMPELVGYDGPVSFVLAVRAVADMVRQLHDLREARDVVGAAVQSRGCTVEQLAAEVEAGPVRGSALLRATLAEVSDGVRSAGEGDLWSLIKRGKLPEPMYNARLYVGPKLIAIADAWWPQAALAVEVDSRQWHLSPADWEETMRRHARMTALGILVLHFSPAQIRSAPTEVLTQIRLAIESRRGQRLPRIDARPAS